MKTIVALLTVLLLAVAIYASYKKGSATKEPTTTVSESTVAETTSTERITTTTTKSSVYWPSVFLRKDSITLEELNEVILGYGWENGRTWLEDVREGDTSWEGIEEGYQVASEKNIAFPLPVLSKNEHLYITAASAGGMKGILFVVIMTVFEEGAQEGKIAGMYYAIKKDKMLDDIDYANKDDLAISAEPLNYEFMDANDDRLFNFIMSYEG